MTDKRAEEILDEKIGDWNITMSNASRVIALEAMEEHADNVTLAKTLQIHARDQRIARLMEVIMAYDEILHLHDRERQTTAREVELRWEIEKYKNEL